MIRTATATAALRDDGIAAIRIDEGALQSLDNARENLAALRALVPAPPGPVLIDMRGARPLEPEVRHFYSDTPMGDTFSAMALVVASTPLGRMMGNVYFRVAKTGAPMRLFGTEAEAVAWLREARP